MTDPSINLTTIPDAIERCIYKLTVELTLNLVYYLLSNIQGAQVFAHKLRIHRSNSSKLNTDERLFSSSQYLVKDKIDDRLLEQVADRLLADTGVNFSFVPDVLEGQIYRNCIKVVFRVLAAMNSTFSFISCGHEVRIHFQPATSSTLSSSMIEQTFIKSASSFSDVDLEQLQNFARSSGISQNAKLRLTRWDSLFIRHEFVTQLQATIYGLILCIVDDLLLNTRIRILSD